MSVFKKSSIFIIFIVITSLSVSCSIKSDNNLEISIPEELSSDINNLQNNSPSVENSPTKKESVFFSGNWNRTGIIRACASSLKITNETGNSFDFELDVFHGDHFGVLSGTAIKDTPRKAEFIIEAAEGYHNGGVLKFVIDEEDKNLNLSFEGDIVALDFGQNVVPDGDYVLGKPYYVSDNYPSLVFGSERVQNKVRRLMTETNENRDDTAYRILLEVMKEGLPELVESGRYKGFIGSGHEMGVDLYISPEEEICIMAYGLEEGQYVFYTSEIIYHGWMTYPEYLVIPDWISREEISFEYCGYYEE